MPRRIGLTIGKLNLKVLVYMYVRAAVRTVQVGQARMTRWVVSSPLELAVGKGAAAWNFAKAVLYVHVYVHYVLVYTEVSKASSRAEFCSIRTVAPLVYSSRVWTVESSGRNVKLFLFGLVQVREEKGCKFTPLVAFCCLQQLCVSSVGQIRSSRTVLKTRWGHSLLLGALRFAAWKQMALEHAAKCEATWCSCITCSLIRLLEQVVAVMP